MRQLTKRMKRIIFGFIILAILFSPAIADDVLEDRIDWGKIESAWKAFYNYPSEEATNRLYEVLPSITLMRMPVTKSSLYFLNYNGEFHRILFHQIWMLEKEVYSGNKNALRVCFKLRNVSAEPDIYMKCLTIIGDLIRINPYNFLYGLKESSPTLMKGELEGILKSMGQLRYTDKEKAILWETNLRIKAIEAVTDESLQETKKQCLEILGREKTEIGKIIERWKME